MKFANIIFAVSRSLDGQSSLNVVPAQPVSAPAGRSSFSFFGLRRNRDNQPRSRLPRSESSMDLRGNRPILDISLPLERGTAENPTDISRVRGTTLSCIVTQQTDSNASSATPAFLSAALAGAGPLSAREVQAIAEGRIPGYAASTGSSQSPTPSTYHDAPAYPIRRTSPNQGRGQPSPPTSIGFYNAPGSAGSSRAFPALDTTSSRAFPTLDTTGSSSAQGAGTSSTTSSAFDSPRHAASFEPHERMSHVAFASITTTAPSSATPRCRDFAASSSSYSYHTADHASSSTSHGTAAMPPTSSVSLAPSSPAAPKSAKEPATSRTTRQHAPSSWKSAGLFRGRSTSNLLAASPPASEGSEAAVAGGRSAGMGAAAGEKGASKLRSFFSRGNKKPQPGEGAESSANLLAGVGGQFEASGVRGEEQAVAEEASTAAELPPRTSSRQHGSSGEHEERAEPDQSERRSSDSETDVVQLYDGTEIRFEITPRVARVGRFQGEVLSARHAQAAGVVRVGNGAGRAVVREIETGRRRADRRQ